MSDLHDLTFTYCHTVMSGTNEHTMNMSKGWGTNSESLGGSTEPFKEVHEIKTIFLIILFRVLTLALIVQKKWWLKLQTPWYKSK